MVSFSPSLLFSLKEKDFHSEVFLSVGLPLEIMATFLYLTRVLFFAVHTRCSHRFTLECHNSMLFLLPGYSSQNYSHSQSTVPITDNFFFFTKGYQAYMHFLYPFLSFNKQLFQLFNFTFSCTLIAFIKGLFFDLRVKIIVLLLANYKSHRLLFLFHALPRIIADAMNLAWYPEDLHFVLFLLF